MGTNDKIEARKRSNQPILVALDYLKRDKGLNQGEVCALLGCNSSLISGYKSGKIMAGDDFRGRLIAAFGGRLNKDFLYGLSDRMLVDEVESPADGESESDVLRDLKALREDFRVELELLRQERQHLQDVVHHLLGTTPAPILPRPYAEPEDYPLPYAAEGDQLSQNVSPNADKEDASN